MEFVIFFLKMGLASFMLLCLTTVISSLAQEKAPVWRTSEIFRKASAIVLAFVGFVLSLTAMVSL